MVVNELIEKIFPLGYLKDFKILINIAIPLFLSSLSQVFLSVISLFFCGHIGPAELDAVSLANTLINIFALTSAYGFSSACDTLFPQIFGGDKEGRKKMGLILQKSIVISIIVSFVSSAALLNVKYLMMIVIEDANVVKLTDEYLMVFIPSVFFYNISALLSKYVQSQNIVYPLMIINFLIIIINSALHALFIYQFELGLIGAAISVNISSFCLMMFIFFYIYFTKLYISSWPGWSFECLFEWRLYLKLALPGFLLLLLEWTNFEIATFLSGMISTEELGVMSITQQLLYICYQIPFGLASAGNIYIGQLLGSNQPKEAKNATKVLVSIAGISMFFVFLILLCLSDYLPYVFSNTREIIERSGDLLKFIAFIHICDASQGTSQGIMRSVGGQTYSTIFMFVGYYICGLPIGLSLLLKTPLKTYGYYIGVVIGSFVLLIFQAVYIYRINWEKYAQTAYELSKVTEVSIEISEPVSKKKSKVSRLLLVTSAILLFIIAIFLHEIKEITLYSENNSSQALNYTFYQ